MAVDEALLDWCAQHGGCSWRFYGWEEPTLSLGYFQAVEDRRRHPASRDCPVVRRISGGGAILHDAELTYSFVLPGEHGLVAHRRSLYESVHNALIDTLAEFGVAATLRGTTDQAEPAHQPFLCFQRRAPGDILLGRAKIAGSAQRRLRGAVLQHGSVILGRSKAAPELAALEDLTASPLECDTLMKAWLDKLARKLTLHWRPQPLSHDLKQRAATLVDTKYGSADWTAHRSR